MSLWNLSCRPYLLVIPLSYVKPFDINDNLYSQHHNRVIQKKSYNDASNIFQELAAQEANDDTRQKISQELINIIHNYSSIAKFIDILQSQK